MSPAVLGSLSVDGLPAELRARAGEFTSRRVLRLLDSWSLAPFLAVMELKAGTWPDDWDGDRTGLITVSDLEPGFGALLPQDSGPASLQDHLARVQERKPTEWLREMVNNPACQAAIVAGLHGPCLHYVGDADTCRLALLEAAAWLESGAADHVLVVAFSSDGPPGDPADGARRSQAAGAALGIGDHTSVPLGDGDLRTGGLGTPGTAVEAMTTLVAALGQTAAQRTSRPQ